MNVSIEKIKEVGNLIVFDKQEVILFIIIFLTVFIPLQVWLHNNSVMKDKYVHPAYKYFKWLKVV